MNDLDVFVEYRPEDDTSNLDVFMLNGGGLCGKNYVITCRRSSFMEVAELGAYSKGGYRIVYTGNDVRYTDINVIGCNYVNDKEKRIHTLLDGFDLNLCAIGIDMDSGEIHWLPAFQDFLYHQRIEVCRPITPIHTAIRLIKKHRAMPQFSCNYDEQLRRLKMARFIGMQCEGSGAFLPTQLLSEYTLKKNLSVINELKAHFSIREVELTFNRDCANEEVKTLYTLDAVALSDDIKLPKKALHIAALLPYSHSLGIYVRAADWLYQTLNQKISERAVIQLRKLLNSLKGRAGLAGENSYIKAFGEKAYKSEIANFTKIMRNILLRDSAFAASISLRDL